jgi:hypothetical protein
MRAHQVVEKQESGRQTRRVAMRQAQRIQACEHWREPRNAAWRPQALFFNIRLGAVDPGQSLQECIRSQLGAVHVLGRQSCQKSRHIECGQFPGILDGFAFGQLGHGIGACIGVEASADFKANGLNGPTAQGQVHFHRIAAPAGFFGASIGPLRRDLPVGAKRHFQKIQRVFRQFIILILHFVSPAARIDPLFLKSSIHA